MKRSAPLRRTPLRRGTSQLKRSRLNPVGKKANREASDLARFRLALHLRSGGFCEARTPACPPGVHEGCDPHHLSHADRDRGVHLPERGLLVCRQGHDFIEQHPAWSYEQGYLLRDGAS